MTVQRQYTLPNCNLKLEGLSTGDDSDPMAPMTVVLNSECSFPGMTESLSGGREFLNALVKTVSDYAQSLLSGIPHPLAEEVSEEHFVTLKAGDNHLHHLAAIVADAEGKSTRKTLELNSVQLFDLVEAIDQLLADTLALPDMTLQLSSLNRRHSRSAEPATKRVFPAAAGLSALAAAAALLFVVPVPEFEPEPTERRRSLTELIEEESANLSEGGSSSDAGAEEADVPSEDAVTEDSDSIGASLGRLANAPNITDEDALESLKDELEETLESELPEDIPFEEPLIYRVAVSETGDVLGYKYQNDAALTNVDDTALPELVFIPLDSEETITEPIAQFEVTFSPDGDVTAEAIAP
ncbi:DUF4335 domain-containing protein [Oscillatoria sp. CS-180]|uniref:DUF4335 domain-containing protein n=1 Tax=Oscillatoria sp. CS-180 TaxID=3021720 RepID=UPI00232CA9FA|nr:DUF4335 domain-containing protein [Oscillatoria sp. CS-180]MDB9524468.1 DUF4335 domain-containing protein [Oscillatoria sp. CS-180]